MKVNKYGTFWRRFWAGLVDGIVFVPILFLNVWMADNATRMPVSVVCVWHVVSSLIWYGYSIWFHARCGQTLGKMVLGVRVMDVSESRPIGFKQALLRDGIPLVLTLALLPRDIIQIVNGTSYLLHKNALPDAASMLLMFVDCGWAFLEGVTMLFNRKRRALHDFIAGSVVVRVQDLQKRRPR